MGSAERPTDEGPLARHEVSLRSRDPAEASAIATRVYREHRLTILGDRRAFAMSLDAASLGPITLGWLSYDTEVRVDAEPHVDAYQINLVSAGQTRAYCGSQRIIATSETGMIFRPDKPTGFAGWRTPSQMLAIRIDRQALEDELEQLLYRPVTGPIAFALALDLSRRGAADWSWLVSTLAASLFDRGPLGTFSAKIDLARALSLIDAQTRRDLRVIKDVRNVFAHAENPVRFISAEVVAKAQKFAQWRDGASARMLFDTAADAAEATISARINALLYEHATPA